MWVAHSSTLTRSPRTSSSPCRPEHNCPVVKTFGQKQTSVNTLEIETNIGTYQLPWPSFDFDHLCHFQGCLVDLVLKESLASVLLWGLSTPTSTSHPHLMIKRKRWGWRGRKYWWGRWGWRWRASSFEGSPPPPAPATPIWWSKEKDEVDQRQSRRTTEKEKMTSAILWRLSNIPSTGRASLRRMRLTRKKMLTRRMRLTRTVKLTRRMILTRTMRLTRRMRLTGKKMVSVLLRRHHTIQS